VVPIKLLAVLDAPAANFNEATVRTAIAAVRSRQLATKANGRRSWRDTGSTHGLYLVVGKSTASWYRLARAGRGRGRAKLEVRIGDATAMSTATAREKALKLAGGNEEARAAPIRMRTDGVTAGKAFEEYLAESRAGTFIVGCRPPKENTLGSYVGLWETHVRSRYGRQSLHHLAGHVPDIVAKLASKPVTAKRLTQVLRNVFAWSTRRGHWHGANPVIDVVTGRPAKIAPPPSRARHLTVEEAQRLLAVLEGQPQPWLDFFRLALLVGARAGSIRHMAWSELDLGAGVWNLPWSKNSDPVVIPLVRQAVEILKARRAAGTGSPFVFPRRGHPDEPIADYGNAWVKIRKAAKIEDVRVHDLRRTVGTWATADGHSLQSVGRLLGHRSLSSTLVYARANTELARQAAEAVASRLEAVVATPTKNAKSTRKRRGT
jgi:integrase